MNTYTFFLKSGQSFDVVGGDLEVKIYDGNIVGYKITDIKTFFKVNISDISAIVQKRKNKNG